MICWYISKYLVTFPPCLSDGEYTCLIHLHNPSCFRSCPAATWWRATKGNTKNWWIHKRALALWLSYVFLCVQIHALLQTDPTKEKEPGRVRISLIFHLLIVITFQLLFEPDRVYNRRNNQHRVVGIYHFFISLLILCYLQMYPKFVSFQGPGRLAILLRFLGSRP